MTQITLYQSKTNFRGTPRIFSKNAPIVNMEAFLGKKMARGVVFK